MLAYTLLIPELPLPIYIAIAGVLLGLTAIAKPAVVWFGGVTWEIADWMMDTIYAGKWFAAMLGGITAVVSVAWWSVGAFYSLDIGIKWLGIVLIVIIAFVASCVMIGTTSVYGYEKKIKK